MALRGPAHSSRRMEREGGSGLAEPDMHVSRPVTMEIAHIVPGIPCAFTFACIFTCLKSLLIAPFDPFSKCDCHSHLHFELGNE
jgi:hypothetical protein